MKEAGMKIIFLDIDGVLNNYTTMGMDRYINKPLIEGTGFHDHLSPYTLRLLNDIIKATNAKVVISSVWRYGETIQRLQKLLDYYGFKGQIIGKTPSLSSSERGYEIQKWLDDNVNLNIESFVIIDDDSDMVHLLKYLVKTKAEFGIRKNTVKHAVKVLNQDKIFIFFNLIRRKIRRVYGYINWKYWKYWKLFKKWKY